MRGSRSGSEAPKDRPEICEAIELEPLRPAIVRVADAEGRNIAVRQLERELAYLKTAHLYGTQRPTYLVSVDLRRGAGGWAPVCTHLAEVDRGALRWVEAVSKTDGKQREIRLCESHHAAWRIAPSPGRRAKDLLLVEGAVDGTLVVARHWWDGDAWLMAFSRSSGSWNTDAPFPASKAFPQPEG